ncbi:hypothetical protein [Streptacidiphilus sp. EB103A]|uniref:hypothetical protein n=1 Tax=Streptacidiphilus sp. EB103A TaxID=3156275 RepID=UPI003519D247
MAVSDEVRAMCDTSFAAEEVSLALRVLNTYEGEDTDRVHRAAVALSQGSLHQLASWICGVTPPLDNFFWLAGGVEPGATDRQAFAAKWLSGFYDKNRLVRQDEAGPSRPEP